MKKIMIITAFAALCGAVYGSDGAVAAEMVYGKTLGGLLQAFLFDRECPKDGITVCEKRKNATSVPNRVYRYIICNKTYAVAREGVYDHVCSCLKTLKEHRNQLRKRQLMELFLKDMNERKLWSYGCGGIEKFYGEKIVCDLLLGDYVDITCLVLFHQDADKLSPEFKPEFKEEVLCSLRGMLQWFLSNTPEDSDTVSTLMKTVHRILLDPVVPQEIKKIFFLAGNSLLKKYEFSKEDKIKLEDLLKDYRTQKKITDYFSPEALAGAGAGAAAGSCE